MIGNWRRRQSFDYQYRGTGWVRFHHSPWLACRSAVKACFQLFCYNLYRPLSLKHRIVIVLCNGLNGSNCDFITAQQSCSQYTTSQVPVPALEVDVMFLLETAKVEVSNALLLKSEWAIIDKRSKSAHCYSSVHIRTVVTLKKTQFG